MTRIHGRMIAGGAVLFSAVAAFAQPSMMPVRVRAVVTYISGSSAYIGAGKEQRVQVGDTVSFDRSARDVGSGVVTAVSARSSLVPLEGAARAVAVGDSATIRVGRLPEPVVVPVIESRPAVGSLMATPAISGRIAVQYFGNRSSEGFATSTPSILANLNIPALFGTGMSFTVHGRAARELSPASSMTSGRSRTNVRLYEMALRSDVPGNGLGFALGRVTPRYAGGLGPIDGVEAFVRTGRFTAGVLGGLQPDYVNSGIDTYRQKAALFLNYAWQNNENGGGDVSVAYGRLMFKGKLDRDFVYLQSSTRVGTTLFLYLSTEMDLTGLEGTERTSKPRLTNTFVNASYTPISWLSLDAGYDATRMVYYYESMEVRSDTLLDNTVRQGIRGGVSFRLPLRIQIGGRINVRPRIDDLRTSRTIVGTFRMGNILQSNTSLGFQAATIKGTYADGLNVSGHLEYDFPSGSSVTLGAERYAYTLFRTKEKQNTVTASLMVQTIIGRRWYLFGGFDQVWENDRPLQRIFAEVGYRL